MPVFISYSHVDRDFVDRLAKQLVAHRVNVWVDRWELNVGDSLITKIQDAISGASALLVILSKASVESEWCKKELSVGLIRELSEKRVVVLPVIIDDRKIPGFLTDKMYADFRTPFDDGLSLILDALAKVITEYQGRMDDPEWHTDWSISWGIREGDKMLFLELCIVEHGERQPYSILISVFIEAGQGLSQLYREQKTVRRGIRRAIVGFVAQQMKEQKKLTFKFEDSKPKKVHMELSVPDSDDSVAVFITARWLGTDTGKAVLYRLWGKIEEMYQHMMDVSFKPRAD